MRALVVAIFLLTYALIASRRLSLLPIGRSAGALLGAVLMVGVGALTPAESYAAVDHDTITLLLGMMLLAAFLEQAGFFVRAADALLRASGSPSRMLVGVGLLAAGLSAVLVNDTVCLFLTPVVVTACVRAGLPLSPYLLALATCANIGSAATLVGNPQNMLIGSLSQLGFGRFLLASAPAVAVGLLVNLGLLWLTFRRTLPVAFSAAPVAASEPPAEARALRWATLVLGGVLVGFFAGGHLGYTALAGGMALIVLRGRDAGEVYRRVDWSLLVFFCGLFVVVAALQRTGLVDLAWARLAGSMHLTHAAGTARFTAAVVIGSNTVSNVPLVLLCGPRLGELGGDPGLAWVLLAFVSTVAGNLTLVGSVANIIVAERAREHHELGFFEYLRFGAVSTVLVLLAGVPLVVLWAPIALGG